MSDDYEKIKQEVMNKYGELDPVNEYYTLLIVDHVTKQMEQLRQSLLDWIESGGQNIEKPE
jgi:hypothetical protein